MATTMSLIAKQTVGANGAASVTFSNIPQTYTDLVIKVSARSTEADNASSLRCYFNGDTSNILVRELRGIGSTAASYEVSYAQAGYVAAAQSTASSFGSATIYVPGYTSGNTKLSSGDIVQASNTAGENYAVISARKWNSTSAVTSVTLTTAASPWVEYSEFCLYGVSNSATQNPTTPYATGGDIISTDGSYWYHTFLYSGTFIPQTELTCDYLVVAGGGGGGRYKAGGGGAGGLRCTVTATGGGGSLESALSLINGTSYTVVVGAGGAKGIDGGGGSQDGSNGGISSFSTITTVGGGGGGGAYASDNGVGKLGGSGGGGQANSISNGGAGTANQGFAGANAVSGTGGGGGGAGEAGNTDATGEGGDGIATTINGTSTYYAGGGGAGSNSSTKAGGLGGGGNGGYTTTPTAGTPNTGGGGGGGAGDMYGGTNAGANGGSGIVIVRYAV